MKIALKNLRVNAVLHIFLLKKSCLFRGSIQRKQE
jgi:hypothetical protein